MNEKKHERFLKVAGHRMDLLICDFRKLGNCASKNNYEYTEREVELIFEELKCHFNVLLYRNLLAKLILEYCSKQPTQLFV